jgi:hypothetical protein
MTERPLLYMGKQQTWNDVKCHDPDTINRAREVVVAMMLHVRMFCQTYNREFIYFKDDIPQPITPVARAVLLKFYNASLDKIFDETVGALPSMSRPPTRVLLSTRSFQD